MPSWRDDASQQAQDDLDRLLDAALPFAQHMIETRGEFLPYAAAIDADGGPERSFAADPGLGEHPPSVAVLEQLVAGLRSQRDDLRAVALVADVRTGESDAVRAELEHREGQAIVVLLPYRRKRLGRGVTWGDLTAAPGAPQVWT